MISGLLLSLIFSAASCAAGVVPTAPGPGQSFKEGGDCTLSWNLDTTDKWTSFSVDLMSGSNTAMQSVTNVFKDRDGTKGATSYTWKCPTVTPQSAIYFYQFTQAGAETTWTTRFTITSPEGEVTPPTNPTQPGGAQIPWGVGRLAGAGAESPPANTSTTVPSPSANITALNTPVANLTRSTNSTAATAATNTTGTTTATTNTSTIATSPTQSTSLSTGSNSKNPSPNVSTPNTASSQTPPTSGAPALPFGKTSVAALTLAAVIGIAFQA